LHYTTDPCTKESLPCEYTRKTSRNTGDQEENSSPPHMETPKISRMALLGFFERSVARQGAFETDSVLRQRDPVRSAKPWGLWWRRELGVLPAMAVRHLRRSAAHVHKRRFIPFQNPSPTTDDSSCGSHKRPCVCDNGTNSDVRVAKASTAFHWQQEEERTFVLLLQWSRITFLRSIPFQNPSCRRGHHCDFFKPFRPSCCLSRPGSSAKTDHQIENRPISNVKISECTPIHKLPSTEDQALRISRDSVQSKNHFLFFNLLKAFLDRRLFATVAFTSQQQLTITSK